MYDSDETGTFDIELIDRLYMPEKGVFKKGGEL